MHRTHIEQVVGKLISIARQAATTTLAKLPYLIPLESSNRSQVDINIYVKRSEPVAQADRKRSRRLSNPRLTACRIRELM
jgi:hypothetical protein